MTAKVGLRDPPSLYIIYVNDGCLVLAGEFRGEEGLVGSVPGDSRGRFPDLRRGHLVLGRPSGSQ